jgi:hypothetical protein
MSIRNDLIRQIITALGGTPAGLTRNALLKEWLDAIGSAPRLWTPSDTVSDVWLDFSDTSTITESLNLVSEVSDKSGNANNFIQSIAASQPLTNTSTINGLNTIDFDGIDDYLPSPISFNDEYTAYFLVDTTTVSGRSAIYCEEPSIALTKNYLFYSSGNVVYENFTGGPTSGNFFGLSQDVHLLEVVQSSANVRDIYADGNLEINLTGTYTGAAVTSFSLGGRIVGGNWFQSNMGEINFLNSVRSLDDRQKMQGYLCWKWGIESKLPVGHPYKDAPPEV